MTSNHRRRQASEDNGARAATGGVNPNLRHLAGFSHVAYCSGPFQLAILLSAFDLCGLSTRDCTVFPFSGSSFNDELKTVLVNACAHTGLQIADAADLPFPTLLQALQRNRSKEQAQSSIFWYCRAGLVPVSALSHLRKILPDIVFEYYDGLGSYIVASEQEKRRMSFFDSRDSGDLRQLAVQRLMHPDRCFMPDDGMWARYASAETQTRTHYLPGHTIQEKIALVGDILDGMDVQQWSKRDSPDVILTMAMLAERRREVTLDDELRMYDDVLATILSVQPNASILAKTHPRSSPEKMHRLQEICARHNARLYSGPQLAEYFVEKSGRHDVAFIGPPSSSLLSAIQFRYGTPFCLSQSFMASYIGPGYGNDARQTMHHQLMDEAGVTTITSLPQLTQALTAEAFTAHRETQSDEKVGDITRDTPCPVCGAKHRKAIAPDPDFVGASIVECTGCSVMFTHPLPRQDVLARLYVRDYSKGMGRAPTAEYLQKMAHRAASQRLFIESEVPATLSGGYMLDVGCGAGELLLAFSGAYDYLVGFEPDEVIAKTAQDRLEGEARIFPWVFEKSAVAQYRFDLITASHVAEHVLHPVRFIADLLGLLSETGVLFIEVPNDASRTLVRTKASTLRGLMHLWYFSPDTLRLVVEKAGGKVLAHATFGITLSEFADKLEGGQRTTGPSHRLRPRISRIEERSLPFGAPGNAAPSGKIPPNWNFNPSRRQDQEGALIRVLVKRECSQP